MDESIRQFHTYERFSLSALYAAICNRLPRYGGGECRLFITVLMSQYCCRSQSVTVELNRSHSSRLYCVVDAGTCRPASRDRITGFFLERGERVAERPSAAASPACRPPWPGRCCAPPVRPRIELVDLRPSSMAMQQGARHQMRVHHGVDRAILETAGGGDAQARRYDSGSPNRNRHGRPEARVPKPAIGVHGRAADRGQSARRCLTMPPIAVQSDRCPEAWTSPVSAA